MRVSSIIPLLQSSTRVSRRILARAQDAILPATCLSCARHVDEQGTLCAPCWGRLRLIEKPYCSVLGSPFSYDLGENAQSADAIANPPSFDMARSVVLYDDIARRLIQGLKFSDRTDLAPWLANWMIRASDGMLANGAHIVPVPLHPRRLWSRRFNQSAELARPIAQRCALKFTPEVLVRVRPTRQQVGLRSKERRRNVQGAFRVPVEQKVNVTGHEIVLIDDVYTTGATLNACARALRRAGAKRISCLTFARVATGEF